MENVIYKMLRVECNYMKAGLNLHMPQTDYDKRLKFSISLFIKCQIIVCVQ